MKASTHLQTCRESDGSNLYSNLIFFQRISKNFRQAYKKHNLLANEAQCFSICNEKEFVDFTSYSPYHQQKIQRISVCQGQGRKTTVETLETIVNKHSSSLHLQMQLRTPPCEAQGICQRHPEALLTSLDQS